MEPPNKKMKIAHGGTMEASKDQPRKRIFTKELRCMLYGFGDNENSYVEVVDMIEDLVIDFIVNLCITAMDIGAPGNVSVLDLFYIFRNDAKKTARLKELLEMNKELKQARKAFDEIQYSK